MPCRRSHHKSRNGCLTCKKRRVKCDEGGPPCMNCKARDTECEYASPGPTSNSSDGKSSASPSAHPPTATTDFSASQRRTIELRLLHRWTSMTHIACSNRLSNDTLIWQNDVPEIALSHDFLLTTIFAITAFDLAQSHPADAAHWTTLALEYQGLTYQLFRAALDAPETPPSHDSLLYCSILLFILALATATAATPLDPTSAIEHTIAVQELMRGALTIFNQNPTCLATHKLWKTAPDFNALPRHSLAPETEEIFQILETLGAARVEAALCVFAVKVLKYMYQTSCVDTDHRSFALSWLMMAGPEFVQTIKDGDDVALLALAVWGVMLEPFGMVFWYAKGFGKRVVHEVADEFQGEDIGSPGQRVIQWALAEIDKVAESCPDDAAEGLAEVSLG